MTDEIEERVAKAIYAEFEKRPIYELARAAIETLQNDRGCACRVRCQKAHQLGCQHWREAMREPTDAILDAIDRSHQFPGPMWRAGIDAALGKVEE